MKKIFTLFVVLSATVSLMAQHGAMNFIGNGDFYVSNMKETTLTTNVKDTIVVEMTENNTSNITLPQMIYNGNLTVNPFTIKGATWAMDMATFVSTWAEQSFTTTTIGTDGFEKNVSGTLSAAYIHSTGAFQISVTFSYGSMPMPVTYESTGYYTVNNVWNLVGRGTAANPYKIFNADDFAALAENFSDTNDGSNEYFVMMNDIDFGGSAENFVPLPAIGKKYIKNVNTVSAGFNGNFDGQEHSISGIYHNRFENNDEGKFNALFSSIDTAGVVKNLVFSANNFVKSYNYIAPFASVSRGAIENCVNYANIEATNTAAAGILGSFIGGKGSIINCINNGNISSMTYAAGIVGFCQSGASVSSTADGYHSLIDHCTNNGNISTTNGLGAAGIAGAFSGSIRNATNNGAVDDSNGSLKTKQYTSGIVSSATYLVALDSCTNNGAISGGRNVAGILAYVLKGDDSNFTVTNCVNRGVITADSIVGGVAGNSARVAGVITLDACENYGVVTASGNADLSGNLRGNANIAINSNCKIGSDLAKLALDPDNLTGINKLIINDNTSGSAYDLWGRRYNGKGLLIRNGKAVLVK